MEDLVREQPGVRDTKVGYTGGTAEDPGYESPKTGTNVCDATVVLVYE